MSHSIHALADVQSHSIGDRTCIWQFVVILPGAVIGQDCNICSHCFAENDVQIGNRITITNGVQLRDGMRIEDDVFIGPNVTFTNDRYPSSRNKSFELLHTRIGAIASIGAGATILPGLTIGPDATIGAGAVVTKNVAPASTVAGNPAVVLTRKT